MKSNSKETICELYIHIYANYIFINSKINLTLTNRNCCSTVLKGSSKESKMAVVENSVKRSQTCHFCLEDSGEWGGGGEGLGLGMKSLLI